MPERELPCDVTVEYLRRSDGLMFGARAIVTPTQGGKPLGTMVWWLNRDADQLEELRPYRVGMRLRRTRRG